MRKNKHQLVLGCMLILAGNTAALGKESQLKKTSMLPMEHAKIGKGSDRVNCASNEWQVFNDAIKKYCGMANNNENCQTVSPAFATCRLPKEFGKKPYYNMQPLSRAQLQKLPNNLRLIYDTEGKDTETNYTVEFLFKNGNWEVLNITLDPPCAG